MIFKAALSNKTHPEYGRATIPFPIPESEYDHTIELLEGLDIGSPTVQDCQVDELNSLYPILNRLADQNVNVDELDYLAKRLESFCRDEGIQFQAMASKLGLSDIKDFINLTFCCQQVTSSEQVPYPSLPPSAKARSFHCSSSPNRNRCAGFRFGFAPISYSAGAVTPYGVVYDNGMKLEQVYTGGSFPQYLYDAPLLTLGVPIQPEIGGTVETAWLYLPAPEQQIARTLERIGITSNDAAYFIEDSTLPPKIFEVLERPDDAVPDLNRLCQAIKGLGTAEVEKLEAVVLMAQPTEAGEIRQLAENLDQFDFLPSVELPEQNSQLNELGYVAYHGSLTLEALMGPPREPSHRWVAWGEEPQRNERVLPAGQDERYEVCGDEMREDPAEQYQRSSICRTPPRSGHLPRTQTDPGFPPTGGSRPLPSAGPSAPPPPASSALRSPAPR